MSARPVDRVSWRLPLRRGGGQLDAVRHAELGGLYSRRLPMIEPVFAQIKANGRIDRLRRRGRAAARSEWRLIAATHNS